MKTKEGLSFGLTHQMHSIVFADKPFSKPSVHSLVINDFIPDNQNGWIFIQRWNPSLVIERSTSKDLILCSQDGKYRDISYHLAWISIHFYYHWVFLLGFLMHWKHTIAFRNWIHKSEAFRYRGFVQISVKCPKNCFF